MPWFLQALFLTSAAALVGALAAIALLFMKRWTLAHRIAKRTTLFAVLVLGVAIAELQVLWTGSGVVAPLVVRALQAGDPGVQARGLADAISGLVNCAALALPAAALGGVGWVVARWEARRSATSGGK